MGQRIAEFLHKKLVGRARQTPYFHLDGYMERYWLCPYKDPERPGCGPVRFSQRPLSWLLQRFNIAARIHHVLASDPGRDFHDHPFSYITIVLKGGYWEVTPVYNKSGLYQGEQWQWFPPGSILFRRAKSLHRLEIPRYRPCTTLFITGPKSQDWGFVDPRQGKTHWRLYLERQQ